MKKFLWFYEFENIFHKHVTISSLILTKLEQLVYFNGVFINNSKLKRFDFDLKGISKTHKKIKDIKLRLLLDNSNGNNNSDFNLFFVFSQIA